MMNSNICCLLVRLAILLGVLLVQSSEEASYQDFLNSHVDFPRSRAPNCDAYCNLMMVRRGLTTPVCMPTNTFINASPIDVQQVCGRGGRYYRQNLYDSRNRFRMTVCHNIGGPSHGGGCQYSGQRQYRWIRLACVNNQPVDFEKVL